MVSSRTDSDLSLDWGLPVRELGRVVPHVVIAWSRDEPHRIGEAACLEGRCVLGRGPPLPDDPAPRVVFHRQRPGGTTETPPLQESRISRLQLELWPFQDGSVEVRSLGRCPLILRGEVAKGGVVRTRDTVTLTNTMVLLVVQRFARWTALRAYPEAQAFPFGAADPYGIVGESQATWVLRDQLAFAAQSEHHVLVLGESGVGKELAARAVHGLSARRGGPFVARNAATFPEGLVDAELFGTARGYPNAGSPERRGLIGEADGGTLFLDEIGELPPHLQAHLLRVLDRGGEYQRLGEGHMRRSSLRLVAATNRPVRALKHDLAARFAMRVEVPGLQQRPEDVPLLLRHLLAGAARTHPATGRYFERREGAPAEARVDPWLVEALLRHGYTLHTRELERLLWMAMATSPGDFLALTPELRAALEGTAGERREGTGGMADDGRGGEAAREGTTNPGTVGRAAIEEALGRARGNVTEAARRLGLRNRFALYRLMKRHGIATPEDDPTDA